MGAENILNNKIEYNPTLRNSISYLFKSIINEINNIIDSLGYNKNDFSIIIYPLTIEMVDGRLVPKNLLETIHSRFKLK